MVVRQMIFQGRRYQGRGVNRVTAEYTLQT